MTQNDTIIEFAVRGIVVFVVFILVFSGVMIALSASSNYDPAEMVNTACVRHNGVERWDDNANSVNGTCRDGYAFSVEIP